MHTGSQTSTPSLSDILKRISDGKSQILFNCIALSNGQQSILIKQMHLSTKQYYSRISGLTNAGLIRRIQGGYSLTSLGRVIYKVNSTIEKALSYYWKMKAIESILLSLPAELSKEDITNLIEPLIDSHEIRDIITESLLSLYDDSETICKGIQRKKGKPVRLRDQNAAIR
jgi:predicted transcriptional regulator